MNDTQAAAYLAGMIDGEGYVAVKLNRSVQVSNTERDLIDAVLACCVALGLKHRVGIIRPRPEINKKGGWTVYITGKASLEKIRDAVPMQSARKTAAVVEAIAGFTYKQRPPREWLEQKYLVEGLSLQQCAEEWGVKHSVSAWCWCEYYDIPRRTAGGTPVKYPRPDREWLQAKVDEGLTLKQIGDPIGAPLSAVWRWCQHYGIERAKEHKHA